MYFSNVYICAGQIFDKQFMNNEKEFAFTNMSSSCVSKLTYIKKLEALIDYLIVLDTQRYSQIKKLNDKSSPVPRN